MEFKVGGIYKTRGGWRAVVVEMYFDGLFLVYHKYDGSLRKHLSDGCCCFMDEGYTLISEWQDPIKRTFWVNVYEDVFCGHISERDAKNSIDSELLDTIQIDYVQGKTHYVAKGE